MENLDFSSSDSIPEGLSWREIEILELLTDRLHDKEIGEKLHLSVSTVKWYNRQIYAKLGVSNRREAVARAKKLQFLERRVDPHPAEKTQPLHNLPAEITSFVGRSKDFSEIKSLLESKRLVTISGPGGIGKTRLAIRTARSLINAYTDGIWLVEFASVSDSARVANEITRVLNIDSHPDLSFLESLKRYLGSRSILLLLDNLEHILDASEIFGELLAASPGLTILATSRTRLNIYGEQEYPLRPLSLPPPDEFVGDGKLLDYEAVDLFIQRVRSVLPGFSPEKQELEAAGRICRQLDGLPLGIELVAPLVKMHSLVSLADRLDIGLGNLPPGPRNMPARQRTLRATLDWSWDLLDDQAQTLFIRMAVFSGGATFEAIEFVCGEGLPEDLIAILTVLVENNLVIPIETFDGEMHFTMLETVREFVSEKFISAQNAGDLCRRHAEYFAGFAESAYDEIRGPRHRFWFLRMAAENLNLQSAFAWSIDADQPEYGLRMVSALSYFWYFFGHRKENSELIFKALEKSKSVFPLLRAKILRVAGITGANFGDREKSRGWLQEALEIYRRHGDDYGAGTTLAWLAIATFQSFETLDQARSMAQEGLTIFQKYGDQSYIALAYDIMGRISRFHGDLDEAEKYFRDSLALTKETGEEIREATLLANLGSLAYLRGDYPTAFRRNREGLLIFMDLPSLYRKAAQLAQVAGPMLDSEEPIRGTRILAAAVAELKNLGSDPFITDRHGLRQFIQRAQEKLGEDFELAWQEGQKMGLGKAVNDALAFNFEV